MLRLQNPLPNRCCVGSERLPEGFGQLVGARSALAAAVDAFQPGYRVGGFHAAHECRYALRVAVAAARERHIADDAVFQFDVDLPGTGAEGRVGYVSGHVYALKNPDANITIKPVASAALFARSGFFVPNFLGTPCRPAADLGQNPRRIVCRHTGIKKHCRERGNL